MIILYICSIVLSQMARLFIIINYIKIAVMILTIGFGLYLFFGRNSHVTVKRLFPANQKQIRPELDLDKFSDSIKHLQEQKINVGFSCSNYQRLSIFAASVENIPLLPLDEVLIKCLLNNGIESFQTGERKLVLVFSFAVFPEDWQSLTNLAEKFHIKNCSSYVADECILHQCNNVHLKLCKLQRKNDFFTIPSCNGNNDSAISNIILKFIEFRYFKFRNISLVTPLDLQLYHWILKHSTYLECNLTLANEYKRKNANLYQEDIKLSVGNFEWLILLRNLLYTLRMPPLLAFGTLLGWRRECGIIPYTHDFDLAIPIDLYNDGMENVLKNHKKFLLKYRFGKPTDSLQYTFINKENGLADVFFMYNEQNYSWIGNLGLGRTKLKYFYPRLKNICATVLLGYLFHVPCNAEEFIRADYGDDWRLPVKDYKWYNHGVDVGEWSLEELPQVIVKYF